MQNTEKKITPKLVQLFFNSLPKKKILEYAKNIQTLILSGDDSLISKKNDGTLVTEADTRIEQMIISSFNVSPLRDLCGIGGEENVGNVSKPGQWKLLIDPIDGSSSLIKGKETWGVMVGLLDKNGILQYSWNLISTGEVFRTRMTSVPLAKISLSQTEKPRVDFYDYGSGQDSIFRSALKKTGIQNPELTSCPAAVWAGWELYKNKLSALVWVVGENEKKTYPDYDLVFLAPLVEQGYKVRLGKLESGENGIVVVAPTEEDADMLYRIAFDIVTEKTPAPITEIKNKLII